MKWRTRAFPQHGREVDVPSGTRPERTCQCINWDELTVTGPADVAGGDEQVSLERR